MIVKDIIDALEEFAPLGIQEKWDNSGLIIGFCSGAQGSHRLRLHAGTGG